MNKLAKSFCITIIHSIFLLVLMCACSTSQSQDAELLIINAANEEMNTATLEYVSSGNKINIGIVKSNSTYKHIINNQQEDSIKLTFADPSGTKHEETVVGYIIKGMKGTISVVVKKTSDGKWTIENKNQ